MDSLTLTRPDDWHLHLRDGDAMRDVLAHTARRFARAVVMPNLKPPVTTVDMALAYRERIISALPPGASLEPLMTLYLTDNTTPAEIARAKQSRMVHAVKYYPAGATTNSESGVTSLEKCYAVFEAMEEHDLPLLVHGEVTYPEVDRYDDHGAGFEPGNRSRRVSQRTPHHRAPGSGGDLGARNATLSIMVGGQREIVERVRPMLERLGKKIVYQGGSGA